MKQQDEVEGRSTLPKTLFVELDSRILQAVEQKLGTYGGPRSW